MRFSDTKGNGAVVATLARMVDTGRIPHAIMLHEDDGGGGIRLALAFLQYLYCRSRDGQDSCGGCASCNKVSKLIHPDIHFVFPVNNGTSLTFISRWRELLLSNPDFRETELTAALGVGDKNTLIGVPDAKIVLDALSVSALEGGYKSVLVYLPEKMNPEASNRLLKIIEEPSPMTQFVFVTHAPGSVLQTISSRCQHFRVMPPESVAVEGGPESMGMFTSLMDAVAEGDMYAALGTGDEMAVALKSREMAKSFCKFATECLRTIFLIQQGLDNLPAGDRETLGRYASSFRKSFPRDAMTVFNRAAVMTARNVSSRIVWADVVCRLFKIR
ncbi:MAG: hypothetical protein MJY44_06335 [Bacteroidales bacterium]|nr:hypothetical protein [Bacteroidales bacterium]